jgi:hypothetical protein
MKSLLLLSLIVLGSFFIFDRFGSSNPSIENPTASTPTVPQSVLTASEGKSRFAILIPIQAAQKSLLSVLNLQSLMENLRVC